MAPRPCARREGLAINIGDLFWGFRGEDAGLQLDAKKAGAAAASAMSAAWGPSLQKAAGGAKAFGAVAAAGFGLASKGALQLEAIQNRFQAETGASAEEAKRAAKVINDVSGDNRVSLESVADAAMKVRTDLGAVGEEADVLTAKFTRYGRATKQEAGAAVSDFDDILDAWNLTAADSAAIMDALVVSHQKYGGSVADDQKALAALAPTLTAANMSWQDGIGLLDLFKASGVDTQAAITGMTKALGKVKSPEELQRLVDDISNTEDPFLRAQKAADLFGAKAGPKMAAALAGNHLADFRIDMDQAAGATDRAVEALDSGLGPWVAKKFSQLGSAIRGIGADWGPAITGAASFATILGTLGLDSVLSGIWKKAAASSVVNAAVQVAGSKAATLYLSALIAGDSISAAASAGWKKVAGSRAVMGAAGLAGTKAGIAFSAAASAALLVAPIVVTYVLGQAARDERDKEVGQIRDKVSALLAEGVATETLNAAIKQLSTEAMIARRSTEGPSGFIAGIFGTKESLIAEAESLEADVRRLQAAITNSLGEHGGRDIGQGWSTGVAQGAREAAPSAALGLVDAVQTMAEAGRRVLLAELAAARAMTVSGVLGAAKTTGAAGMTALAQGILSARQKPVDAFNTLKEMLTNAITPLREVARFHGQLTSKELAKGLRSGDPAVRAQAIAVAKAAADRLGELALGGGKSGRAAMRELDRGIRSKIPAVRAASLAAKNAAVEKLQAAKGPAGAAGEAAGQAFAARLKAAVAAGDFHVNASVGFTIPNHWTGGAVPAGLPTWVNERGPEIFVPSVAGRILSHEDSMAAVRGGGGSGSSGAPGSPIVVQVMLDRRVLVEAAAPGVTAWQQSRLLLPRA